VQQHYDVVGGAYELDTKLPSGLDPQRLVESMRRDKKAVDSLTFVLDGPAGVEMVAGVPAEAVEAALATMAAR
jgi:5-deoxy-5-amino-3-dehydroquinate synthase